MEPPNSESPENDKPWFPKRIRDLRVASNKTQRQVAEGIGVKESTYANAEATRTRRLRLERVMRLARYHELNREQTDELVAGWQALPESDYNKRNAKPWAARDAKRSKLKSYNAMKRSLIEMTTRLITNAADPDSECTCDEVDMFAEGSSGQCELCEALRELGLTGWTTLDEVVAQLAKIQEGMTG